MAFLTIMLLVLSTGAVALLHAKEDSFAISSPSFLNQAPIPLKHACTTEGNNLSPLLKWSAVPQGTKTFALVCFDTDAPNGFFVHWIIYNIPSTLTQLDEGIDRDEELADGSLQGVNSFDHIGYDGPCPPAGKPHHYHFKLYALNAFLEIDPGSNYSEFEKAMKGHVISQAEIIGLFRR